jgi:hypothetical protein
MILARLLMLAPFNCLLLLASTLLLTPLLLLAYHDAPGTSAVGGVPSIAYCCWPLLLLICDAPGKSAVAELLSIAYSGCWHPFKCSLLLASFMLLTSLMLQAYSTFIGT